MAGPKFRELKVSKPMITAVDLDEFPKIEVAVDRYRPTGVGKFVVALTEDGKTLGFYGLFVSDRDYYINRIKHEQVLQILAELGREMPIGMIIGGGALFYESETRKLIVDTRNFKSKIFSNVPREVLEKALAVPEVQLILPGTQLEFVTLDFKVQTLLVAPAQIEWFREMGFEIRRE